MAKPKLLIIGSISGTSALQDGEVTAGELDEALFALRISEETAFADPVDSLFHLAQKPPGNREAMRTTAKTMRAAATLANSSGRGIWKKPDSSALTFEELNKLLSTHGLEPFSAEDFEPSRALPPVPTLGSMITKRNPGLVVV